MGTFFLALKVFGAVDWSLWWVFLPWILLFVYFTLAAYLLIWLIAAYVKQHPEDMIKLSEYLKNRKGFK